jgi:probable rRNA maturation factor
MKIEITNLTEIDCEQSRIESVAEHAMNSVGLHPDCELSISLVDEIEMSNLHQRWMDEPGATDVLSFPMDEIKPNSAIDGPGMLGDVILCPEFAAQQAKQAGNNLQDELELLTIHGILHLVGYDHREADEKKVMFELQDRLLVEWRATQ